MTSARKISNGKFAPTTGAYSLNDNKTAIDNIFRSNLVERFDAHELRAGLGYDLTRVGKTYDVTRYRRTLTPATSRRCRTSAKIGPSSSARCGSSAVNIHANRAFIPNYGDRWRNGEAISTAFVESAVNQIISRRFVKKQQCAGLNAATT